MYRATSLTQEYLSAITDTIPDNANAKPCLALSLVEERPETSLFRQYRVRGAELPQRPLETSGAEEVD